MNDARPGHCLYTILYAPRERLEPLLLDAIAPILHDLRRAPELESLFFVRYSEPRWQLRVRVLGERSWVEGPVRARIAAQVEALARAGEIEGFEFAQYEREWERYGGTAGMFLAERLFTLDSLAALDLMESERRAPLAKSRREWSLLLIERMLRSAALPHEERLAFYRRGYEWALGPEGWDADDLAALDRKFDALQPALDQLLSADPPADPESFWGGAESARIAERLLAEFTPPLREVLDHCRSGHVAQNSTYLLWSYAHMMTNRLGIESTPEAILRYFMYRLLESQVHGQS